MAHLTVYYCDQVQKFVQKLADFQTSIYIILHNRVYEHVCWDRNFFFRSFEKNDILKNGYFENVDNLKKVDILKKWIIWTCLYRLEQESNYDFLADRLLFGYWPGNNRTLSFIFIGIPINTGHFVWIRFKIRLILTGWDFVMGIFSACLDCCNL